ncbi:exported hypothetical protein [Nostocoides japonicum T1-X7]|uniref:DUF4352 domain-containing protein n=1 Tax=Nostocoides japonicum T1-X7 TaxID=1194083 RepID=A0A077LXX7_9MICO|nr:hypothetical protein [Tetrasphaera japonica]CCH77742.1 exported hypothetical protein [Tetrasphaera japonica T1-X7]
MIRRICLGGGALLLLAGCAGTSTPAATVTVTQTVTATVTTTASSSTTPDKDSELKLGQTLHGDGVDVTVTQFKAKVPMPQDQRTSGQLSAAMVKSCLHVDVASSSFSWTHWNVAASDSSQYPSSGTTWGTWPGPMYPVEKKLKPGDCVKGWIYFDTEPGVKIARIEYSTDTNQASWQTG